MIWVLLFYALVFVFTIRTAAYSFSYFKNKKRGAIPLLLISVLCLISPFLSVLINRLILFL